MLRYIKHALYKLEKTKITFEQYWPINLKLCQLAFNYLKFYAISHFIQCIQNLGSAVNYNIAYTKMAYKYFLKAFYNKINKKEYNLQIWQYNIRHKNIIVMKDVIVVAEKSRENKELLIMENADKTAMIEVA